MIQGRTCLDDPRVAMYVASDASPAFCFAVACASRLVPCMTGPRTSRQVPIKRSAPSLIDSLKLSLRRGGKPDSATNPDLEMQVGMICESDRGKEGGENSAAHVGPLVVRFRTWRGSPRMLRTDGEDEERRSWQARGWRRGAARARMGCTGRLEECRWEAS